MALYLLSGTPNEIDELETIGRRTKAERKAKRTTKKQTRQIRRTAKKEKRQVKKVARKEKRATRKAEGKGLLKKVLRVPMAPARAAFLLGVKVNALKLATKLLAAYRKNPARLRTWWNKQGGDWNKLAKAISQGSKTKISSNDLGSIAATLAAAAPILIAATALFKELGLFGNKNEELAYEKVTEEGKEMLLQDPNVSETYAQMPEGSETAVMPKQDWLQKTQEGAEFLENLQQKAPELQAAAERIYKGSAYADEQFTPEPQPAPTPPSKSEETDDTSEGMSTGAKIALGVAGVGIVGALIYFMKN